MLKKKKKKKNWRWNIATAISTFELEDTFFPY